MSGFSRSNSRADRLERFLEDPFGRRPHDQETCDAMDAARALRPGVAANETFRAELKSRMLREAQHAGRSAPAPAPALPDTVWADDEVELHVLESDADGRDPKVVMADLEPITPETAQRVETLLGALSQLNADANPIEESGAAGER